MDVTKAQAILDKIINQIFGVNNLYSLAAFQEKYAFDVRLPLEVTDSLDGKPTWAQSDNPEKFMRKSSVIARTKRDDWLMPSQSFTSIDEIVKAWQKINIATAEYTVDSREVAESANIYSSSNVFRSLDVDGCKNILFCDGINKSEYIAAGKRTTTSNFCVRIEDSAKCSNSFGLSMCENVTRSFFIQDSTDLSDCIFCSHLIGKQFCIANVQLSEIEYHRLRPLVLQWILDSNN